MIYIDADQSLTTWRHIAEAGGYTHYQGRAGREDVIIRFGANHGQYQGHYPAGVRVLNPRLILDKRQQSERLARAGVRIPTVFTSTREWEAAGRPQLIRKPTVGQMGTGVARQNGPPSHGNWTGNTLYQTFIDKDREFRAMMVGGLLAFFMEKHRPQSGDVRWNEHRGSQWTRVAEDRSLRNEVKRIGQAALAAVEYDFGAIDLVMHGRDLYVLEVNSRPEFGEQNARRFTNAIRDYLAQRPSGAGRHRSVEAPGWPPQGRDDTG